jgi:hypothetical protein
VCSPVDSPTREYKDPRLVSTRLHKEDVRYVQLPHIVLRAELSGLAKDLFDLRNEAKTRAHSVYVV